MQLFVWSIEHQLDYIKHWFSGYDRPIKAFCLVRIGVDFEFDTSFEDDRIPQPGRWRPREAEPRVEPRQCPRKWQSCSNQPDHYPCGDGSVTPAWPNTLISLFSRMLKWWIDWHDWERLVLVIYRPKVCVLWHRLFIVPRETVASIAMLWRSKHWIKV